MVSAMVLSAGYGTRLRPLTDECPKPLVPVGDRPLLAHIAERLRQKGFEQFVINTHHRPSDFKSVIKQYGLNVHVNHEPKIRGTAGGIAAARQWFSHGPLIVWNGDILADPPIESLIESAESAPLTLAVRHRAAGEGTVGLGDEGRIVRLRGRRFGAEACGGDYVGVAALSAEAVRALPHDGCLFADYALPLLEGGGLVSSVRMDGDWADVGTLAAYLAENLRWGRAHGDGDGVWRGDGAHVDSAVVARNAVIGSGAQVDGVGLIDRVVVWPGARVRAPLANAVVTAMGTIVPIPEPPGAEAIS